MAGGFIAKGDKAYPGRLTGIVLWISVLAATGGLIFGYDIGISGGVTSMTPFLKKFFPHVYERQEHHVAGSDTYCKFDDLLLTLFTSSLYLAALVASFVASTITRSFGRRSSMIAGGLLFLIGAILNLFARNVQMLIVGRIFLGFGVGFANQSAPVYLSEMAPYKYRGALNMLFQLSITVGILAANVINYFTALMKNGEGWRVSLGCAAVPALIFVVGSVFLGETPNSLIDRGKKDAALRRLKHIRGVDDVQEEYNDLIAASEVSQKIKHPWRNLMKRKYRPQLVMCILIPFFQQLTGMNAFMFYAPVLFKTLGFGSKASLMSSLISGAINCVSTLVSIFTVDRFGRKLLFIEGGIQMFICQIVITAFIGHKFGTSGDPGVIPSWYAYVLVAAICVYVAGFAWSWGPLGWLVPAEVLPLEVRSAGQSINVSVNMIFTFVIAQCLLKMLCKMKFGLFIFFAFFVFSMTVFAICFIPETKGIPIEEISGVWKTHWYWSRFVEDEHLTTVEVSMEEKKKIEDAEYA